jgi:hypothetical protein
MSENTGSRKRLLEKIDTLALAGVLIGVFFMGQPFSKAIFLIGFPVVLCCTALHMVLDHLI